MDIYASSAAAISGAKEINADHIFYSHSSRGSTVSMQIMSLARQDSDSQGAMAMILAARAS